LEQKIKKFGTKKVWSKKIKKFGTKQVWSKKIKKFGTKTISPLKSTSDLKILKFWI
jgi:hypothetical protein